MDALYANLRSADGEAGVGEELVVQVQALLGELTDLRSDMLKLEAEYRAKTAAVHPAYQRSARNLFHYLALRKRDMRPLQDSLAALGLSSLGRSESHALASVHAVLAVLHQLAGREWHRPATVEPDVSFVEGKTLLDTHTAALLGPPPAGRDVHIMVTMPSEAARDYGLVRDLLAGGMNCMRINCAHDDAEAWAAMIGNLRSAEHEVGTRCRILMDLAGPKLRTGPIEPGPQVIKWRPRRDRFGTVTQPARVWLTSSDRPQPPPAPADACLPVAGGWLARLQAGAIIKFFDARGSSRSIQAIEAVGASWWAESSQTAYIHAGLPLYRSYSDGSAPVARHVDQTSVGELPAKSQAIVLRQGDMLIVTRDERPGRPAAYDDQGHVLRPASIGITLPEIFPDLRVGEAIWFDDGKIGGRIHAVEEDRIEVAITHARPTGEKLAGGKGINLPDSQLRLPALTTKDVDDLAFIARHADLVGYSFVRQASDVDELHARLADLNGHHLGIVLKIETRRAFEALPSVMLAAMRSPAAGVMIARGDLAVECGYERMAEVQEEMLWMAEAAHMPVIWATQVLETLAKMGQPSRAEITDAAMGERAECVMLNKGPYIVAAVRVLENILRRMQAHQSKKVSRLRPLSLAQRFAG
jgi:pyruvate kinase